MHIVTFACSFLLIAIGLYGYLGGSDSANGKDSSAPKAGEVTRTEDEQTEDTKVESENSVAENGDASSEKSVGGKSKTALIPALVGFLLLICGTLALKPEWLKHAMHVAAMISLLGALAGFGRAAMVLLSDKPANIRAVMSTILMALICTGFLVSCVLYFINARKARQAAATETA